MAREKLLVCRTWCAHDFALHDYLSVGVTSSSRRSEETVEILNCDLTFSVFLFLLLLLVVVIVVVVVVIIFITNIVVVVVVIILIVVVAVDVVIAVVAAAAVAVVVFVAVISNCSFCLSVAARTIVRADPFLRLASMLLAR